MRYRTLALAALATAVLTLSACGGSGGSAGSRPAPGSGATTVAAGAADPNAPEVVEPGDIPDDQVFVTYTPPGASFSVKVPEGWARSTSGGVVTFTDKYNSIEIRSRRGAEPSVASVRASGLADVSADPTFHLLDVAKITRTPGTGIRATYTIGSAPNAVTGKKALLAVERYEFGRGGTVAELTLSGAKGADNVDPWRMVSDSVTWS
ncbi:MAG: lipoprotein [Acidimicrobiales bacterium]|nr:lipoprotein [Acidimicrobiales bacterium]